jgi:ribonuclease HII
MFDQEYFKANEFKNKIFIAGCDEVGRGPLAGPVVAACVSLHQKNFDLQEFLEILEILNLLGVSDSKKIPHFKREMIVEDLGLELSTTQLLKLEISNNSSLRIWIQEISVDIIDEINILNASLLAMKKSFEESCLEDFSGVVLIDGNKKFISDRKDVELEAIIKGDSKSLFIGLASIVAKVYRDRLMKTYSLRYPGYSWEKNAGYGTLQHLQAIASIGVTPYHRKTFRGVKEYYEKGGVE